MKEKMFKTALGIAVICLIYYLSSLFIGIIKIKFPPALLGMTILFALLRLKIISEEFVESACNLLLDNMVLFFVPLTVGIVLYSDILMKNIFVLGVVVLLSTMITMVLGAFVAEYFVNKKQKEAGHDS